MGGIEATKFIRQAEIDAGLNKRVPIIAVTANAREAQMENVSLFFFAHRLLCSGRRGSYVILTDIPTDRRL